MKAFRTIQLKYIKRIFFSPSSTPNALAFLETGLLPVEKVINIKQLTFLHHVLTLDDDDPVKVNYQEQIKYEFEINWGNEVKNIRHIYDLQWTDDEILNMSKEKWKNFVEAKVRSYALNELNTELKEIKYARNLTPYDQLIAQPYLKTMRPMQARIIFQIRTHVIDLKGVRKYQYDDTVCRLCGETTEDIHHVMNQCTMVTRTYQIDPLSNDECEMEETARRYKDFSDKVKKQNAKN